MQKEIPITYSTARNTIFLSMPWHGLSAWSFDIFIVSMPSTIRANPDCHPHISSPLKRWLTLPIKAAVEGQNENQNQSAPYRDDQG